MVFAFAGLSTIKRFFAISLTKPSKTPSRDHLMRLFYREVQEFGVESFLFRRIILIKVMQLIFLSVKCDLYWRIHDLHPREKNMPDTNSGLTSRLLSPIAKSCQCDARTYVIRKGSSNRAKLHPSRIVLSRMHANKVADIQSDKCGIKIAERQTA